MRLVTRFGLANRGVTMPANVVISNVPGPRQPLYFAGARMDHYIPVSTIAEGMGLNITVHSYLDRLDFGLIADRELVPDLWDMADMHIDEIGRLFDATGATWAEPQAAPSMRRGGGGVKPVAPTYAEEDRGEEDRGEEDRGEEGRRRRRPRRRRPRRRRPRRRRPRRRRPRPRRRRRRRPRRRRPRRRSLRRGSLPSPSSRVSRAVGYFEHPRPARNTPQHEIPDHVAAEFGGIGANRETRGDGLRPAARRSPRPARGSRLARGPPRADRTRNSPRPATWCRTGPRRGVSTPTRSSS